MELDIFGISCSSSSSSSSSSSFEGRGRRELVWGKEVGGGRGEVGERKLTGVVGC